MTDPLKTGASYFLGGLASGLKIMKDSLSFTGQKAVEIFKVRIVFDYKLIIDFSKLKQPTSAEKSS